MDRKPKSNKTRVIKSRTKYWDWVSSHNPMNSDGEIIESFRANPDNIAAEEQPAVGPRQIMYEAVEHLQGQQKEVYILLYREGLTMREAAAKLNVSVSTIQHYDNKAVNFIKQYCQQYIHKESEEDNDGILSEE